MHRITSKQQVKEMKKSTRFLSHKDDDDIAETTYLLRSPANAKHLLAALKRPKKAYKTFKSVAALKDALGL